MKHINNKINHLLYLGVLLIFLATLPTGCKKDDTDKQEQNVYLVEYSLITGLSETQVLNVAKMIPEVYDLALTKDLSEVKVYKLIYKTINVDGNEIVASGAVIVPVSDAVLPLLSYQHGTLTNYSDAPSQYSTGMEVRGTATIIASAGFVVSVPDYLGYGESKSYPHPYEHAQTLARTSFDMLMAVQEFCVTMSISLSDKLFLTGYSEGGGATMALHRYIEVNSDLVVTMSAPASGAYNKTAFAKEIIQTNEDLYFLPEFMWVIDSYNWIYGLNRPWNQYVNEPYATTLESVTDPFLFGSADISLNPQVLFTQTTIDGVSNSTDTEFMNALADNDNFDWTPQYPVTLYYGTADDYVFPINSETAYNAMYANGADITRVIYDGADHSEAYIPYIIDVFEMFESLK
jgi:dienelactone hydrolase